MKNLFQVYLDLVHGIDDVLADMSTHGVQIDKKAQDALREKVELEIQEELEAIQKLVPPEVCPTKTWKKLPKDRLVQEIRIPGKVKVCSQCQQEIPSKTLHQKGKKNPCKGAEVLKVQGTVPAWMEVLPFNPLSTQQLMDYCRFMKHPIGTHIKTGNATLNVKQLQKLQKKFGSRFPIYGKVLRIRGLKKVESTFIFKTDANNRATGVFKHTPETLRLAMQAHNFMQVSHRGTAIYADEIRKTVIASPGNRLVQGDSAGIEAVFVAYFAGDEDYMRIAKMGPHAYLTCLEVGLEFNQENANLVKKDPRYSSIYSRCKTVIHMSGFGGGPSMLHHQFPDVFPTTKDAERAQQKFFDACPAVPKWWKQIRELAQKQGYLTNPWGFRNYYYNVFRRDHLDPNKLVLAEDSKECVAFLPQSSAAMFMRENLRILGSTWARPYMPIIGSIHDSLCLDVPEGRVGEAVELLEKILTRNIPQMRNLQVGCDIEVGENWAGFDPEENPKGLKKVKAVRV